MKRQKSKILNRSSLKSQTRANQRFPFVRRGRRTKAQLKIQQMTFMLLAVTLFFVLVGMLVLALRFSGLKESATELEEKNAMLLVTRIANSPEFSCGNAFGKSRTNCIDADKVMMLKKNIDTYDNFWGTETNIEIRKIYPKGNVVCTIRNYPNCNLINLQSKKINVEHSNFISLCRKDLINGEVYDRCELAKIMVSYKDWRENDS
ncbi:hypothetical protein KAT80_03140 [Candidatus Pacearchaeota archaeon]|nr:hypothetical protein [Candidatus Pacearchaeota archaeon]